MNTLQKTLLSFGIIIISGIFIYLLIIFFNKTRKKMYHNKIITMNLVIKYKPFIEYLEYQIKNQEAFHVFLLKINNLNLLEKKYDDEIIKSYLRMIAKELSVYLPFAGKIAQTNNRDTFIIYYPTTNEDMIMVGERFKSLATKSFHRQGLNFNKGNSIAVIDHENYSLKNLTNTIVHSVRNLGKITAYNNYISSDMEEYMNAFNKVNETEFQIQSLSLSSIKNPTYKEVFNDIYYGNIKFKEYLLKFPTHDQAWINMFLIEYILGELNTNNIFSNISIPILFNTLEQENFISVLEQMVIGSQFLLEQIILSVKITNVSFEEAIIKNILTLNNLGVKVSLEIESFDLDIYAFIQKYQIQRIEVTDRIMADSNIAELLYFAKVNNIEVLYITLKQQNNLEALNVSHITKEVIKLKETNFKRKRGRK